MSRKSPDYQYDPYYNIGDIEEYSKDKKTIADNNVMQILTKMQSAFKWNGLPETVEEKWLEYQLQTNGWAFFTNDPGDYYTFTGGIGGSPDVYYQPTICTISNPALNYSAELKIGEQGILISNDTYRRGLLPVIGKYAGLLAENTLTIRIADILSRLTFIMSAQNDKTKESADEFLRQLEDGKLGIIKTNQFNEEDLQVQPAASSGNTRLTDLIEMEQYLKASLYNELGLQANYNMKREAVNSSEAELGDDVLQPLIDNMLAMRKEACEKINKLYGLNVSVELNSAWADNEETRNAEMNAIKEEGVEDESEDKPEGENGVPEKRDSDDPEKDEKQSVAE